MCILSVGRLHDKPPPPQSQPQEGNFQQEIRLNAEFFCLSTSNPPLFPQWFEPSPQRYRSYPISPVQEDQNKSKRELPPQPMLLDTYEIFGEMFKNLTRPDPTRDLLKTSNDPPGRFRKVPDAAGPVTLKNSWPDPSREIWNLLTRYGL